MRPYTERRASVSRAVYGTTHRQTAHDLLDHAEILIDLSVFGYSEEAVILLREAADISRRVMGHEDGETVEIEQTLAVALFAGWQYADDRERKLYLLDEAEPLAEHVVDAYRRAGLDNSYPMHRMAALLGRIAHARGNHEQAAVRFSAVLATTASPDRINCGDPSSENDREACADYAATLRKMGRNEEAEAIEDSMRRRE
jgi:hypothetical protein